MNIDEFKLEVIFREFMEENGKNWEIDNRTQLIKEAMKYVLERYNK